MKIHRIFSESGYLLHARPYRETSLLMDIFTRHYGRVSLVARGVRKPARKKLPPPVYFIHYDFSWIGQARSELYTLTQAECQQSHFFTAPQLCCGLYLNELLCRVLQKEDAHPEIFDAYETVLSKLSNSHVSANIEINLRLFEKNLLQNLGYGFSFEQLEAEKFYLYQHMGGLIAVHQQTSETVSGESMIALFKERLEPKHLGEVKRLMRSALWSLIGEKPLKSRELFL